MAPTKLDFFIISLLLNRHLKNKIPVHNAIPTLLATAKPFNSQFKKYLEMQARGKLISHKDSIVAAEANGASSTPRSAPAETFLIESNM